MEGKTQVKIRDRDTKYDGKIGYIDGYVTTHHYLAGDVLEAIVVLKDEIVTYSIHKLELIPQ